MTNYRKYRCHRTDTGQYRHQHRTEVYVFTKNWYRHRNRRTLIATESTVSLAKSPLPLALRQAMSLLLLSPSFFVLLHSLSLYSLSLSPSLSLFSFFSPPQRRSLSPWRARSLSRHLLSPLLSGTRAMSLLLCLSLGILESTITSMDEISSFEILSVLRDTQIRITACAARNFPEAPHLGGFCSRSTS